MYYPPKELTYPPKMAFWKMILLFPRMGYVNSLEGSSNFHPYLGKIPILTNIFQMGWNHQLDVAFLIPPPQKPTNGSPCQTGPPTAGQSWLTGWEECMKLREIASLRKSGAQWRPTGGWLDVGLGVG